MENEGLFEEDFSNKGISWSSWKVILKAVMRNKKTVICMFVFIILQTLIDLFIPILNSYAIKNFFEAGNYDNVGIYIAIYVCVAILYGFLVYSFLKFVGHVEIQTSYELRKDAFRKLQELPFSYFDVTPQGWIMARVTSDSRKLSEIISWGCNDFLWGFIEMIGIVIILFVTNVKLACIVAVVLPIIFIFAYFINKKILVSYRNARKINSEITGKFNEGFLGSKTTKSLVIENSNKNEFEYTVSKYRKATLRAVIFSSLFGPFIFLISYLTVGATLYTGAILGLSGSALYLFIDYSVRFFDPVIMMSQVLGDFQQAQASAERIVSLITTEPQIKDSEEVIEKYGTIFEPKKENYEPLIGSVEFKDVSFKYNTGEQVLSNFNLNIKTGQSVALVGHTGSGKSTIVNLICRFYEPTEGEILIDGRNYKERSIGWLHSNLGYVLQSPQLFSGTILENVRYGRLDATDEECIEALRVVKACEFIEKLDDKYNTEVGEGGSRLSLGERQLISFARAVVANPRILILDEATSSIDVKTESLIQNAIEVVLKGRTSFMIAHRLSTVVNADLILVMDEGKIVEQGKHHELLEKKGYYFELYKNQFQREIEEKMANF